MYKWITVFFGLLLAMCTLAIASPASYNKQKLSKAVGQMMMVGFTGTRINQR